MSTPKNLHPCPSCDRLNPSRFSHKHPTHTDDWYICGNDVCRMAYRTMSDCAGGNRRVIAQSTPETRKEPEVINAPSPCCGVYGKVTMSWQEGDKRNRRHKCKSCGAPFVSVTEGESVTVLKRFVSKRAVENA